YVPLNAKDYIIFFDFPFGNRVASKFSNFFELSTKHIHLKKFLLYKSLGEYDRSKNFIQNFRIFDYFANDRYDYIKCILSKFMKFYIVCVINFDSIFLR